MYLPCEIMFPQAAYKSQRGFDSYQTFANFLRICLIPFKAHPRILSGSKETVLKIASNGIIGV